MRTNKEGIVMEQNDQGVEPQSAELAQARHMIKGV